MSWRYMEWPEWIALIAIGICLGFLMLLICVDVPLSLYTDAQCLKQGYPSSRVTIDFDRYCVTTEGAIVPRVVKQ